MGRPVSDAPRCALPRPDAVLALVFGRRLLGPDCRAVERRNVLAATAAARQLGHLSVAHALATVVLYAETGDGRFEGATARWHARFVEAASLERSESELALAAVAGLNGPARAEAAEVLASLARRHRVPNVEAVLRRLRA